eukprot:NODE_4260_length_817_cov_21.234783_g4102_i0.p1 GENE.NODE_4260_length_817_cov_21.234783_g4102_i0~~NODE_4260_length_817_cov_21.234783_g4102_i0.p1  ORF type:complete len:218 (-),score=52.14 NODE_4260_length_817_cov_21.234783_g4102_i0:63-716(-)
MPPQISACQPVKTRCHKPQTRKDTFEMTEILQNFVAEGQWRVEGELRYTQLDQLLQFANAKTTRPRGYRAAQVLEIINPPRPRRHSSQCLHTKFLAFWLQKQPLTGSSQPEHFLYDLTFSLAGPSEAVAERILHNTGAAPCTEKTLELLDRLILLKQDRPQASFAYHPSPLGFDTIWKITSDEQQEWVIHSRPESLLEIVPLASCATASSWPTIKSN